MDFNKATSAILQLQQQQLHSQQLALMDSTNVEQRIEQRIKNSSIADNEDDWEDDVKHEMRADLEDEVKDDLKHEHKDK